LTSRPRNWRKLARLLIGMTIGAAVTTPLRASVDLSALDMRVAMFAGALPGAEGGPRAPIDRRLKLADCAGEPSLAWRSERRDAVVVSCQGAASWRIFVPIQRSGAVPATTVAAAGAPAPVTAPIKAEPVIRRGDAVTIQVATGAFAVTRDGVALSDAPAGGRLRIKIDDRPNPVQAVAVEPGLATIPQGIS
jgi:flagella basal body P-ring formation protein FlgA